MTSIKWQKETIGTLCQIVKGKAPTMKTKPGAYPLVTMGEEHKTADSYQLDAEAVCVPMISSFGHGKAGLKRVHYIKGKFALSNILTALIVKEPRVLSTKYLALYLQTFKDQLIVPLQTGAANMSLRPDKLAGVPVYFPTILEQEKIVRVVDDTDTIRRLSIKALERSADLIPSIFFSMFGDPTLNNKNWKTKKVGSICNLVNGAAFKPNQWGNEGLPIVRIQNLNDPTKPFNYYSGILQEKFRVRNGDILLAWSGTPGTSFGCFRWQGPEGWLNQHIFNVKLNDEVNGDFYIHQVNAKLRELIAKAHGGVGLQHVTRGMIDSLDFILPPIDLQNKFAKLANAATHIQNKQSESLAMFEKLYTTIVGNSFEEAQ